MNAAEWLRVSTGDQDASNQQPALTAMREQRGDDLVASFTVEASASQGKHRGDWRRMVAMAQSARIQRVYVWSLDRVSREGVPATFAALSGLLRAGCIIVSYREPWLEQEPGSPEWELLVSVTAYNARKEAERFQVRTLAGLDGGTDDQGRRVSRAGKPLGRPPGSGDSKKRRRRRVIVQEQPE